MAQEWEVTEGADGVGHLMVQIEIHAERNEILDQSSLIMRYQAEIAALRRQLEEAARGKGVAMTVVDPMHPEVYYAYPLNIYTQWNAGGWPCGNAGT
jgi:hypothetical protein